MRALSFAIALAACGGEAPRDAGPDVDAGFRVDAGPPRDAGPPIPVGAFPTPNEHSWNGAWSPTASEFPLAGLLDDEYFDGHAGTPILPPGAWDWSDASNDLANWRNFETNLGTFEMLRDATDRHFGWRFVGAATPVDYQGPAEYFEGSSGADWMDLGSAGSIHSIAGTLGDGPDVLVFGNAYSLDYRTGTSDGALRDDDLVVMGCTDHPDGSWGITTTTIHTGPGRDWVFARDLDRAAIDAGNGAGGRTDTIDPSDGADLVVLRGNTHDFRVFGGGGDDVVIWLVDENVQTTEWLGPNFFGGGGNGTALFDDTGVDRLVLAIPADAPLVTATPTPNGSVMVRSGPTTFVIDPPTAADPFAAYCLECGESASGEHMLIAEYNSADGAIRTGYFGLTAFDELQIGVGAGARVYRLDNVAGTATLAADLTPTEVPGLPSEFCAP